MRAEQERNDAVADNAALKSVLGDISTTCETKELRFYEPGDANGFVKQRRVIETVWEKARTAYTQPHPGAALLEQHRKELEAERTRLRGVMERLAEEVSHFTGRACAADFMAVLSGIEDVAKHARNEGLEKAARLAESIGANAQDDIRALKEPEE